MSKKHKKKLRGKNFSAEEYSLKIQSYLYASGKKPLSLKELMAKCRCEKTRGFENFSEALRQLISDGKIYELKRGFVRTDIIGLFKAKILRLNRTYGFMEKCSGQEEIFVPGKFLLGAMPGDLVLAEYIASRSDKPEGRVLDVLKTEKANFTGIIVREDGTDYFLADTMPKIPMQIVHGDTAYEPEEKVLAQIVFRGKRHSEHKVKIVMSFGSAMRASNCAEAIVIESGAPVEFSEKAVHEAKMLKAAGIWPDDYKDRLDLREEIIFTIDSSESKDLDDAVSLERTENGYRLGVHIADVSHYVKGNSLLDNEALERGTSIYYADKVIPMLPKELSNGICSLNPFENRLAFSAIINISPQGETIDYKFVKSVICSKVKGVYSEINALLDGGADETIKEKYAGLEDTIRLMDELADILISNRRKRGTPEIETSESRLIIENDICRDVTTRSRGKSEMMIEAFMLAANETAAKLAHEREIPFVYRVHEPPSPTRISDLKEGLRRLNIEVPVFSETKPFHLAQILENAKDKPVYPIVNMMTLRSMAKAWYGNKPKGHFGLALEDYAHFTSPIRRYPDLAIHRILTDIISGADNEWLEKRYSEFAKKAAQHSSETELRAMNIERDCEECYKAEYMQQHIGEEFEGIISSTTEFGFYVQLPNTIDGLVHINSLPEGNYIYDGYFRIADEYSDRAFSVGDRINVICAGTDVNSGKVDFEIADR